MHCYIIYALWFSTCKSFFTSCLLLSLVTNVYYLCTVLPHAAPCPCCRHRQSSNLCAHNCSCPKKENPRYQIIISAVYRRIHHPHNQVCLQRENKIPLDKRNNIYLALGQYYCYGVCILNNSLINCEGGCIILCLCEL